MLKSKAAKTLLCTVLFVENQTAYLPNGAFSGMFWNQVVPGVVSSTSCQLYIYRRAFKTDSRPPTRTPLVALNILVTPLQRIGFYTGSVCVPHAVGASSMIHLLHDLQEVCQSLNYVKHNEKHVIGWCYPAVGSFRLRCWVYSFSTTLRTFAIRNNLTAGSYFLSRDRATDKIAQKLLSFTTFCYRHTIDSSNHTTALPSTKRWHTSGFAVLTEWKTTSPWLYFCSEL